MAARFLFSLTENVPIALKYRKIGHKKPETNLPDGVFFIADSKKGEVIGPFAATSGEYTAAVPINFYRGAPDPIQKKCYYLMDFVPLTGGSEVFGIPWLYAADVMGVNSNLWRNLRQSEFSDFQIDRLVDLMMSIHEAPDGYKDIASKYEVALDDQQSQSPVAIREYWKRRSDEAQEQYECSEKGFKEICFPDDQAYYNWLESTDL